MTKVSKGLITFTNIRAQYFPNRVEVKVKGLGWVNILNPQLQGYQIQSSIPYSRYLKVIRWAERKGVLKIEKTSGTSILKGG